MVAFFCGGANNPARFLLAIYCTQLPKSAGVARACPVIPGPGRGRGGGRRGVRRGHAQPPHRGARRRERGVPPRVRLEGRRRRRVQGPERGRCGVGRGVRCGHEKPPHRGARRRERVVPPRVRLEGRRRRRVQLPARGRGGGRRGSTVGWGNDTQQRCNCKCSSPYLSCTTVCHNSLAFTFPLEWELVPPDARAAKCPRVYLLHLIFQTILKKYKKNMVHCDARSEADSEPNCKVLACVGWVGCVGCTSLTRSSGPARSAVPGWGSRPPGWESQPPGWGSRPPGWAPFGSQNG
eukprot:gene11157-biopygen1810